MRGENLHFTLNGKAVRVWATPEMRGLDVLRDALNLTGTKEGCGVGECGACTIVVDGQAVTACLLLASQMEGREILTVEGLSQLEIGRILQSCFVEGGAIQCGFCTPGMLMSAYALLAQNPNPTKCEIQTAIAGNLCRCTGYLPIVHAVQKAAVQMQQRCCGPSNICGVSME